MNWRSLPAEQLEEQVMRARGSPRVFELYDVVTLLLEHRN